MDALYVFGLVAVPYQDDYIKKLMNQMIIGIA